VIISSLLAVWVTLAGPPAVDADGEILPHGALTRLGTTCLRPGGSIEWIGWSADGRTLLSVCSDHNRAFAHLWDPVSGRLRDQVAIGHTGTFSPDGRRILYARDGQVAVVLHDLSTGRSICEVEGTFPAAFAPDGKTFVFFRRPELILANAATGKDIRAFGRIDSRQTDRSWPLCTTTRPFGCGT
jgi:WD40 repeat protein